MAMAMAMAMAGPAPGKPLITFGDMLRDLSDRLPVLEAEPDEPDSLTTIKQKKIAQLRAMFYSSDPKAGTPSTGSFHVWVMQPRLMLTAGLSPSRFSVRLPVPETNATRNLGAMPILSLTCEMMGASDARSTQFEGLNLVDAFERVYADLMEALSGDGDEWVSLSEQLSTVLETANQLIATAQKGTGPLVDEICSLQALVERGRSALANAQTSMDQS